MTRPLFVQGLSKRFGGLVATRDVNLELALGQVHAVIGPNGAGKTTLISLLSGLLPADAGTIEFFGQPLQGLSQQERVRAGLVRSFQITSIFSGLSVLENLQVSVQRRLHRDAGLFASARADSMAGTTSPTRPETRRSELTPRLAPHQIVQSSRPARSRRPVRNTSTLSAPASTASRSRRAVVTVIGWPTSCSTMRCRAASSCSAEIPGSTCHVKAR